jgi:hypothetical protein
MRAYWECYLPSPDWNSAERFLQPRIVQSQGMRDGIYAVLPSQFDRSSLPQRLR